MADKSLFVEIPWTEQPQGPVEIDWANPITNGLIGYLDVDRGYVDIRKGLIPFVQTLPIRATTKGLALSSDSTSKAYTANVSIFGGLSNISSFAILQHPFNSSDYGSVIRKDGEFSTVLTDYGTVRSRTVLWTNNGSFELKWQPPDNKLYAVTAIYNGSTFKTICNGVVTSIGATGTISSNAAKPLCIAGAETGSTENRTSNVLLNYVWSRVLSDKEIVALTANPWQIFKPRKQFIGYSPKSAWSMKESVVRGASSEMPVKTKILTKYNTPVANKNRFSLDFSVPSAAGLVNALVPFGSSGAMDLCTGELAYAYPGVYNDPITNMPLGGSTNDAYSVPMKADFSKDWSLLVEYQYMGGANGPYDRGMFQLDAAASTGLSIGGPDYDDYRGLFISWTSVGGYQEYWYVSTSGYPHYYVPICKRTQTLKALLIKIGSSLYYYDSFNVFNKLELTPGFLTLPSGVSGTLRTRTYYGGAGRAGSVFMWNRALNPSELPALLRDPHKVLQTRQQFIGVNA